MGGMLSGGEFIVPPDQPWPPLGPMIGQSDSFTITRKPAISIVTPWRDHPELIPAYESAVKGAEVVIVDTGSTPENNEALHEMVLRLGTSLFMLRQEGPFSFARACNAGLEIANGDIIIFLNNDIAAEPG